MRNVSFGLLVLVLFATSCSTLAPVKINPGDQCFRCRRLISDVGLAAEMIDGSLVSTYKTAGCLAKYLADHPSQSAALFVTDYPSRTLVSPSRVLFVPAIIDPLTNQMDFRAYLSVSLARAAAAELKTQPIDWNTVLAQAKL